MPSVETARHPNVKVMQPLTVKPDEAIRITILGGEVSKRPLRPVPLLQTHDEYKSHGELRRFVSQYGKRVMESRSGAEEKLGDSPQEDAALQRLAHGLLRDGVSDEEAQQIIFREVYSLQNGTIDRQQLKDFSIGAVDEINVYIKKHFPYVFTE
jgi:hypothetical protein